MRSARLFVGCTFCVGAALAVAGAVVLARSAASVTDAYVGVASDLGAAAAADPRPRGSREVVQISEAGYYTVAVATPDDCEVGFDCDVTVTVEPSPGWHANRAYPFKLLASAEPGLGFQTRTTRGAASATFKHGEGDVELREGRAIFRMTVRPQAPGVHRITGKVKVGVCSLEQCRMGAHDIVVSLPST